MDMDKETLASVMEASYKRIADALDALTPEQWDTSARSDAQTVKDTVFHLAAWIDRLNELLDAIVDGKTPLKAPKDQTEADVDDRNAEIYEEHRDGTPAQALGAFRRAYGELIGKVHELKWDDLAATDRFEWLGSEPLWRYIAGDSYEHFDEHLPDIEQVAGNH